MYSQCILLLETGRPFYVVIRLSSSHKDLAVCKAKKVSSFFSYFKTLNIGPALGIETRGLPRSTVMRSIDWTSPTASQRILFLVNQRQALGWLPNGSLTGHVFLQQSTMLECYYFYHWNALQSGHDQGNEVNFFGTQRLIQAELPSMKERPNGLIINNSSYAGVVGTPSR